MGVVSVLHLSHGVWVAQEGGGGAGDGEWLTCAAVWRTVQGLCVTGITYRRHRPPTTGNNDHSTATHRPHDS